MINFKPVKPQNKKLIESYTLDGFHRGCEFAFANLCLWGKQNFAIIYDHLVLFSHFGSRTSYPFPVGKGDKKNVLDAIITDAKERDIPCVISGVRPEQKELLEELYPDKFRFHSDSSKFDYVYDIEALATLAGRKLQSKRNHCNRFYEAHPDYKVMPVGDANIHLAKDFAEKWFVDKLADNPDEDYDMEKRALERALKYYNELELEGILLLESDEVLAFTIGNRMNKTMFDVNFEKAKSDVQGAYAVINREFANYIHQKYPEILYFDREEDMGIEGLRKAKQSYKPHHQIEKYRAYLIDE